MQTFEPYPLDRYTAAIVFFLIITFAVCGYNSGFSNSEEQAGYHEEVIPADVISYIDGKEAIPLADGCYPLALPSEYDYLDENHKRIFPRFLILVPKDGILRLYPLNLSDHSILERHGSRLVLHHLILFSGRHIENSLRYDEKTGTSPSDDYAKKAFYYLLVSKGYGEIQRGYMSKENAGNSVRWYKDLEHVDEELLAIHFIINGYPGDQIETEVLKNSIKSKM